MYLRIILELLRSNIYLKNRPISRRIKIIFLSVFFVFYAVFLWLSLSQTGILIDGHFYKKNANMTTITYSCSNMFADCRKITLQKQFESTVITIDENCTMTFDKSGNIVESDCANGFILPEADWSAVASQDAEITKGTAKKQPYFLVFIVYALFLLSKIFNTKVYEFFFKGKAAGESYYKAFDVIFTIVTLAVLIYFILPL